MTIHITCNNSNCAKRVRVRDDLAGRRIKCPVCGTVQAVPSPSRVAVTVPQEPQPEPPPVPVAAVLPKTPSPRRKRWPWIAGAGAVALLIVAVSIWALSQKAAEDDSDAGSGALRVSKVIRARRGLLGDGQQLNVNFPERDVVLVLKVKGVPASARTSPMNLMLNSHVMAGNEKRDFNSLVGVENNRPLWLGTIIPADARSVTLHLHGLDPLKIDLPNDLVDEAKMFD